MDPQHPCVVATGLHLKISKSHAGNEKQVGECR